MGDCTPKSLVFGSEEKDVYLLEQDRDTNFPIWRTYTQFIHVQISEIEEEFSPMSSCQLFLDNVSFIFESDSMYEREFVD